MIGAIGLLALLLSGCQLFEIDSALTTFEPAGPFAQRIDDLFWLVFWIATGIFVLVQGGLILIMVLFRDRPGREEPKQIHGNAKLEVLWTIIPAVILASIAVPTVSAVFDLTECSDDAMVVEVIGHQWWFEYRYPDQGGFTTANSMVIPTDEEVCATMTSDDVLHNFWVPALNGKRYLIPGQTTVLRLQADEPGEYWGHCAEFCGLSHSLMRARVHAVPRTEFDAWAARQNEPAPVPEEGTPEHEGYQVYAQYCTQCHTVDFADNDSGVADNILEEPVFNGPNLTHFADEYRTTFAGAALPDAGESFDAALKRWIENPPNVKPGSYMPDLGLTESEIDAVITWLKSNK